MRFLINFKLLFTLFLSLTTIVNAQYNLNTSSISITKSSAIGLPTSNNVNSIPSVSWTQDGVTFKTNGVYIYNNSNSINFIKDNGSIANTTSLPGNLVAVEIIGEFHNRKFKLSTSNNNSNYELVSTTTQDRTVRIEIPTNKQKKFFKIEETSGNNSNHRIDEIKLIFAEDYTIWNGSSWSNGIPTEFKTAVLLADPIHNFTAKRVIFGNNVTITSNRVIESVNELDNSGGYHVVFEHNARVIQRNNIQNKGIYNIKRKSKPLYRLDMMFWSSPVKNQNVFQLSPLTQRNMFFEHNEFENIWESENINENSVFGIGKSLVFRVPDNFNPYNNGRGIAQVYEGTFKGELNNGDIVVPVKKQRSGLNAVGNPYSSPISIQKFLEENPNVLNIYVWDASNKKRPGGLENWVSFGLDDWHKARVESHYLNTATGFLIKLNNGAVNQTIKFTNDMRLDIDPTINFRTEEQDKYWLSLYKGEELINSTMIAHLANASNQYNQNEDVITLGNVEGVYSIIQNVKLNIQGRALVNPASDVVQLSVNIPENGTYSIALDKFKGRFATGEHTVYLKDKNQGVLINLSQESTYEFVSEQGIFNDRFEVVYTESTLGSVEQELTSDVIIYNAENQVVIDAPDTIKNVEIIGIDGKTLNYFSGINEKTFKVNSTNKKQLVLFKVTLTNGKTIVKKYIF